MSPTPSQLSSEHSVTAYHAALACSVPLSAFKRRRELLCLKPYGGDQCQARGLEEVCRHARQKAEAI